MCLTLRSAAVLFLLLNPPAGILPAHAQISLDGRIVEESGQPVPFANVQLLAFADSSFISGAVADEDGAFKLDRLSPGDYRLFVSLLGYHDHLSDRLTLTAGGDQSFLRVTLHPATIEMEELSVEARRSLYEQQGDRLVVNVGHSVTLAGATALEVLERSPGVIVNRLSETISLIGKDGVRLMINGKLSYIPADGLVQYLSGLSADNILSIELITAPSADLDAEGNAGFINLILKRNPDDGLNGSMTLSGGYGRGELGSASTDINYRRNRVSLHGSYSFLWDAQDQLVTNLRQVIGTEGTIETPTETFREPVQRNHNVRLGIDFELSDRTIIGALVGAYDNRWSMDALNRMTVNDDGLPITQVDIDNDEINHWRHRMGSLNLRQKVGAAGMFSVDLDHLYYHDNNPTDYFSTSTDVASGHITQARMESDKLTPLHISVVKTDYATRVADRWEVGIGAKGSFSRFTNEAGFASLVQDEWLSEAGLDSKSRLLEDVLAVYSRADVQLSQASSLKMGLRYEFTDSDLRSQEDVALVDRRFGSLFPSVAYSHKLTEHHQVGASYTRRITRPSFTDMAPFLYFLDPYTFFSGNAALQPAIINTVKADFTYKSLLTSIQYAWEDSTIARFQSRLIPGRNVQVMSPLNFRQTQTVTALAALPFEVTGWWSSQGNGMVIWREVDGYRNGRPTTVTRVSFMLDATQNISLPHDFAFEASAFYQSTGLFGIMRMDPVWGINLGLQRTLPAGKGKLTLSVNDVFDSVKYSGTMGTRTDPLYLEQVWDLSQRTFQLTYSTRFGDGKAGRNRAAASEEESGRV